MDIVSEETGAVKIANGDVRVLECAKESPGASQPLF